MNTPPVTPREGTRRHIGLTGDSRHEVLTPAKTDDFSRPSSIRLPKQGFRSPITTFKQPIIRVDEAALSPPLIKKRKSGSLSPRELCVNDAQLETKEVEGGIFSTPPHRTVSTQIVGAPRKPRRVQTTQDESDYDLFSPVRVLDFGTEGSLTNSAESVDTEAVNWDSLVGQQRNKSYDASLLKRVISVIALSGLDVRGECSFADLKTALSTAFTQQEIRRCLNLLRCSESGIYFVESENKVRFPPSFSPAEVLRDLLSVTP